MEYKLQIENCGAINYTRKIHEYIILFNFLVYWFVSCSRLANYSNTYEYIIINTISL